MVLVTQNAIPDGDVAARIAQRTLANRGEDYADEVRRILDTALALMHSLGTARKPRVSDIVAAAGVSNDAFYRYFSSKDALVTALLEDGAERLTRYLSHQMAKEPTPQGQLRRWVDGVLSQADGETGNRTLAVLWNGGEVADAAGRHFAARPVAALLREPLRALGSKRPELDAALVAHAVLGCLSDHLWERTRPSAAERKRILEFCLKAAAG
ncbi:MAG: TetR/AcrR family transcriptional regulator [Frankiaceae bacterium]|nr:TetR/AcrR family transcriptional regulator [Frankiaceae bacterium]MBV9872610.1 TetR/AcrR family transcriptional regulator [Frankiaceae bacterium]